LSTGEINMQLEIGPHTIHHGDSRDVLAAMPDNCVDAVVCDPPYALVSIVKRFGQPGAAPAKGNDAYARASAGFMGQSWDTGEVAFATEFWAQVLRVLKPGGHVVAFSGTRTYHRLAVAIEDSGFEIRDQIFWCYGSGFPKSHNVSNQLVEKGWACSCGKSMLSHHHATDENMRGLQKAVDAIEPVSGNPEPDLRAGMHQSASARESATSRTPETILRHDNLSGVRGISGEEARLAEEGQSPNVLQTVQWEAEGGNAGGERLRPEGSTRPEPQPSTGKQSGLEGRGHIQAVEGQLQGDEVRPMPCGVFADGEERRLHNGTSPKDGEMDGTLLEQDGSGAPQGSQPFEQRPIKLGTVADKRGPQAWGGWPVCGGCGKPVVPDGLGTSLKPAHEPIVLARKPLIGTVAANVLEHGTGAINIDGCRIEGWKPQVTQGVNRNATSFNVAKEKRLSGPSDEGRFPANILHDGEQFGENGRYFYSPKASKKDRGEGNTHPTVKPTDLMAYLCRLVTPPGGVVLDPFMGSGSTGKGAHAEGFRFIGIEREENFFEIAAARLMDLA
jgi:DNA modification methylase